MTITMTVKNQVTIPKKIVNALDLEMGAMFDVHVVGNKIELIPLEVVEKVFTDAEYAKLAKLVQAEKKKGTAKKVTKKFIDNIK